jgi:hypothetical protein
VREGRDTTTTASRSPRRTKQSKLACTRAATSLFCHRVSFGWI